LRNEGGGSEVLSAAVGVARPGESDADRRYGSTPSPYVVEGIAQGGQ